MGTGKTLAYLVGCILWQMNRPERMKLPIVISTSSVALQDAILTEYLPDLSAVLLDEGIITAPITAVVRKGKERFVCDARLAEKMCIRDRLALSACGSAASSASNVASSSDAASTESTAASEAVSYTHLDVYKRQRYGCYHI